MTRNVHFAPANVLYSPAPSTPSPTHSLLSLPSSAAPSTPPFVTLTPMPHPRSPFEQKASPLPQTSPAEMQIHFILAFIPYGAPSVQYDVSLPLSSLEDQVSSEVFAEPATHPPLANLSIICPQLSNLWQIEVTSWSQPGAAVTVYDVFKSIHHGLRRPVHPVEYADYLALDPTRAVDRAYYRRCNRIDNEHSRRAEESKGVKRVDFLMGRNRFLGLSGTLKGHDIWELNVS